MQDIKINSLSESEKRKVIKDGKKVYFYGKEFFCPKDYQILAFDPNLFKESTILTYSGYLSRNMERIRKQIKENKSVKRTIIDIYKEYDNFGDNDFNWAMLSSLYWSETKVKKMSGRSASFGKHWFDSVMKESKEKFMEFFRNPNFNESDYKKIIRFLRLKPIKMRAGKAYINKDYAKCELEIAIVHKKYPKSSYNENPNDKLLEMGNQKIAKINEQKNKELSNYIKQINNDELRHVIKKHIRKILNTSELINDNEELIEELQEYSSTQLLNLLKGELNSFNDELINLRYYFFANFSEFETMGGEVDDLEKMPEIQELTIKEEDEKALENYMKDSVENQNKVKNETKAFWPIVSNGKELNWEQEHCPLVMIRKKE